MAFCRAGKRILFAFCVYTMSGLFVVSNSVAATSVDGPPSEPLFSRDYFCGAYSAWHMMRFHGMKRSVRVILDEIPVVAGRGCSLLDISDFLRKQGIENVIFTSGPGELILPTGPLILYYPPNASSVGHFVFAFSNTERSTVLLVDGDDVKLVSTYEFRKAGQWRGHGLKISEAPHLNVVLSVSMILVFSVILLRTMSRRR